MGALSIALRDTVALEVGVLVKSNVRRVGSDTNVDCFGAWSIAFLETDAFDCGTLVKS